MSNDELSSANTSPEANPAHDTVPLTDEATETPNVPAAPAEQAPTPPAATPAAGDAPRYAPPVANTDASESPLTPSALPAYAPPVAPPAAPAQSTEPTSPSSGAPYSQEPAAPTYAAPTPPAYSAPTSSHAAPPAPPAPPVAPYPAHSGAVSSPRTNVCAILSLIFAFVFSPAGIVLGHIALSQIKKSGEQGRGLAMAGTIVSYVFTAIGLIFIIIYVLIIAALIGSGSMSAY